MTTFGWILICALGTLLISFIGILFRGNGSKLWLKEQFEWFKGFFEETAGQPNMPSHKNLIVLALVAVWCIAFLKTLAATAAQVIPDISEAWLAFFLGALGIRAAQSVFETNARAKAAAANGGTSAVTPSTPTNKPTPNEP